MKIKILFLISIVVVMFASCTKDVMQPNVVPVNTSVKFSTDVYPLFSAKSCTSCHDANGSSAGLSLTGTSSEVRTKLINKGAVIPGNAATSPLYIKFADGATHNGLSFSPVDAGNVKSWINLGALDN